MQYDFVVKRRSSQVSIVHNDKNTTYLFSSSFKKGVHLIPLVKKNITSRLDKNEVSIPDNIKVQDKLKYNLFDTHKIDKYKGRKIVGIDINGCYFNTLFKLGYIDKKTYDYAMSNQEWKLGRNASIGSLNRKTIVETYTDGKLIKSETQYEKEELRLVRVHVISHVWEMLEDFIKKYPSIMLMYLTDCIYVDVKHKELVKSFYIEKGYRTKEKYINLLDRQQHKITWIDPERQTKLINDEGISYRYFSTRETSESLLVK